jgi:hypothetical protein
MMVALAEADVATVAMVAVFELVAAAAGAILPLLTVPAWSQALRRCLMWHSGQHMIH